MLDSICRQIQFTLLCDSITVDDDDEVIQGYMCDIFGYHIWLQSDAAFYYPRLDKYSFSVGMFWVTCDLTRRPLGRLATASSLEGNASRHGERGPRGFSLRQVFDGTRPIADI